MITNEYYDSVFEMIIPQNSEFKGNFLETVWYSWKYYGKRSADAEPAADAEAKGFEK